MTDLHPSHPAHGRTSGYTSGCRCDRCVQGHRRRCKSYRARAVAAGGSTKVDATEARKVLADLAEQMSLTAIGKALGTSHHWPAQVIRGGIKRIDPKRHHAVLKLAGHRPVDSSHVAALGTMRRLQALHAMGYTWTRLAEETGYSLGGLKAVVAGKWGVVEGRNAEKVREVYERLSLVLPVAANPHEQSAISAARNSARRKGWPPPLAWDHPDDPNERPDGWQYAGRTRAEHLVDLDEQQIGIKAACTELGINRASLEKWCERHDLSPVFQRMVLRDNPHGGWQNQHGEAVAS